MSGMDSQHLAELVRSIIAAEVEMVVVLNVEAHDQAGLLVNAVRITGSKVQLVPLHVGRLHLDIQAGDVGAALLPRSEEGSGFYLSGVPASVPEGWTGATTRLSARTSLELDGVEGVAIQGPGQPAARKDDPISATIPASVEGGATIAQLAVALLATGAFVPSGVTAAPTPPTAPITFTGQITGGSAEVTIGGGDV